jgi:hypothetical protein
MQQWRGPTGVETQNPSVQVGDVSASSSLQQLSACPDALNQGQTLRVRH